MLLWFIINKASNLGFVWKVDGEEVEKILKKQQENAYKQLEEDVLRLFCLVKMLTVWYTNYSKFACSFKVGNKTTKGKKVSESKKIFLNIKHKFRIISL